MGLLKKVVEKVEDAVFGKQERLNAEIEAELKKEAEKGKEDK